LPAINGFSVAQRRDYSARSFLRVRRAKILLRPASPGTGIIAGRTVRAVLEAAGVKDILSKSLGSNNAANVVKATLKGLLSLRLREDIYKGRGFVIKKVEAAKPAESGSGNGLIFMRLHNLKPRPGAKHRTKRLGQGESSAMAKPAVAAAKADGAFGQLDPHRL